MMLETGRVVAIEPTGLWVETIQRSACASCQANKGCGHSALANFAATSTRIWVSLGDRDSNQYRLGSDVTIGVPDDLIAKVSLLAYMLPLLTMVSATFAAHRFPLSDGLTAVCALIGLIIGAAIVRVGVYQGRIHNRLQPVLIDDWSSVQIMEMRARD